METFNDIFTRLKRILSEYEHHMIVKADTLGTYYLDTKHILEHNKQNLFFASAQIKKNYVSYYLMPVYVCTELVENIPPSLKKRMQGKSCFNFKKFDEELFKELEELTKSGFEKYKSKHFV